MALVYRPEDIRLRAVTAALPQSGKLNGPAIAREWLKAGRKKAKGPVCDWALLGNNLTMSYFHTGTRTIIGAKAFHCPVRDGKEWDHLAMVIRLDLLLRCLTDSAANS